MFFNPALRIVENLNNNTALWIDAPEPPVQVRDSKLGIELQFLYTIDGEYFHMNKDAAKRIRTIIGLITGILSVKEIGIVLSVEEKKYIKLLD